MKKILSILLACAMMLSLAACVAKDDKEPNVSEDTVINESQEIIEKETDNKEKEEKKDNEKLDKENESDKDEDDYKKDEETDKSEESKESEEESKKDDSKEDEKDVEENDKGVVTVVEGSALQTASEFSGLYQINGYSRMNFMGNISFSASVTAVNSDNHGDIDLSKANVPDILNYLDYLYISLTFENNEIVDWDFVDRKTNESILHLSDDDLLNLFFPEANFEIIDAGKLPEIINLSDYEIGKTYAFEVGTDENFSVPNIINDTEYSLLIVSTKSGIEDIFEREYKPKIFVQDNSVGSTYSDDGKYYISILEGDSADVMSSEDCLLLDGYAIGDELDFDFEEFIGNNTDKTITIISSYWGTETEITLAPGEVAEISWMNDVTIKDIK